MHTLKEAIEVIAIGAMIFLLLYFGCVFLQSHLKQPVVQNMPQPLIEQLTPMMVTPTPSPATSTQKNSLVPPPPPMPVQ
jgi:hypothetical protein